MATLPFERLKIIRSMFKDTVFGYIRGCQSYLPADNTYYQIPELVQNAILLFYYQSIESNILTREECDKLLSLFDENNKFKDLGHFSYKMIYSSKRDGNGEKIFKSICHNEPNLLCVIHTKRNTVFGGYTSRGWTDDVNNDQQNEGQFDDKSFVYNMRSNQGYEPKIFNVIEPDRSLWIQSSYYMMFAGSCVIYINSSGRSGHAARQPERYQKYPKDFYLHPAPGFQISAIEVFQLQHD